MSVPGGVVAGVVIALPLVMDWVSSQTFCNKACCSAEAVLYSAGKDPLTAMVPGDGLIAAKVLKLVCSGGGKLAKGTFTYWLPVNRFRNPTYSSEVNSLSRLMSATAKLTRHCAKGKAGEVAGAGVAGVAGVVVAGVAVTGVAVVAGVDVVTGVVVAVITGVVVAVVAGVVVVSPVPLFAKAT